PYVVLLLPFDLAVGGAILFAQLCGEIIRGRTSKSPKFDQRNFKSNLGDLDVRPRIIHPATIVIVNWDGKHLLAECLPALIESVKCAGGDHEILVVDNGSTDGSAEFVRQNFPQVRVLALDRNYGFAEGNNRGAHEAQTDVLVFLNNDMVVDR